MKFKYDSRHLGIKLLPITISKIIGTLFGVAIVLSFGGAGILLLFRPGLPIATAAIIIALPFYIYYKNDPEGWSNDVTFDFDEKVISKNGQLIELEHITKVKAEQFESFIFPTYYKISIQDKSDEIIKLIAIRSAQDYTDLISAFHYCKIQVN